MKLASQHRIYICFFLFACSVGALLARIPDLQSALNIDKSHLGLTLIGMAMGSLISLTFASPIIARLGARSTAFLTVLGTSALISVVPWLDTAPQVFFILFCEGLLAGALEVNLNVEIDRIEAQLGRGIMNRAHGFWSVGFFFTALAASAIRQLEISMRVHLAVGFLIVAVVGSLCIAGIRNAPARPVANATKPPLIAFPTLSLLPLCIIGIGAFLIEGAGIDWSTIYMRDTFALEPWIEGLGLTFFTFFMASARLLVDPFVDRFGARTVAIVLLLTTIIGILSISMAPHPYVALIGFGLLGSGCSAVYPLAVSAAAQRTDRPAYLNVGAISQMSFVIFFLAPPALGFVAEYAGIRTSYLTCLPIVFAALLSVGALPPRRVAVVGLPLNSPACE
jgi:MFS family permease